MTTIDLTAAERSGDLVEAPPEHGSIPGYKDRQWLGVELREVETTDSLSMIRGLAVPFGKWANIGDMYLESFAQGAFAKSIREAGLAGREIPLKMLHPEEGRLAIGRMTEWSEQPEGLQATWTIDDDEQSQVAARKAHSGSVRGLSIEFQPIRARDSWEMADEWNPMLGEKYMDRVTRHEARLGAVALVHTPAFVEAGVRLVRSRAEREPGTTPMLDAWRRELEQLRADA